MALFSGAGGGILGGKLLGWRTVCAVEWEAYPASVLCARQNDGLLETFPIWDDVQTFDGKPWRGIVDVVSGGFPCQDISAGGKGEGIDGERSGMWREMVRVIHEVQPRFVFVENSPMLTSRGLGRDLGLFIRRICRAFFEESQASNSKHFWPCMKVTCGIRSSRSYASAIIHPFTTPSRNGRNI